MKFEHSSDKKTRENNKKNGKIESVVDEWEKWDFSGITGVSLNDLCSSYWAQNHAQYVKIGNKFRFPIDFIEDPV